MWDIDRNFTRKEWNSVSHYNRDILDLTWFIASFRQFYTRWTCMADYEWSMHSRSNLYEETTLFWGNFLPVILEQHYLRGFVTRDTCVNIQLDRQPYERGNHKLSIIGDGQSVTSNHHGMESSEYSSSQQLWYCNLIHHISISGNRFTNPETVGIAQEFLFSWHCFSNGSFQFIGLDGYSHPAMYLTFGDLPSLYQLISRGYSSRDLGLVGTFRFLFPRPNLAPFPNILHFLSWQLVQRERDMDM
jgi:hypothetical protein